MKYKLLEDDFIFVKQQKLYRIKAIRDIENKYKTISKGELGGYIQFESNLSQENTCWVDHDATVMGNAVVKDDAMVSGNSIVCGNAIIEHLAYIQEKSTIKDFAVIMDFASVCGATVGDKAIIRERVRIDGTINITGTSIIEGRTLIKGQGYVGGKSVIRGADKQDKIRFHTFQHPVINGNMDIFDSLIIGPVEICECFVTKNSYVCGNLLIRNSEIHNSIIGKDKYSNLWEEDIRAELNDAFIVSSKNLLIKQLDFVYDKKGMPIIFMWYKKKKYKDFFCINTEKKSIEQNNIEKLFNYFVNDNLKSETIFKILEYINSKDSDYIFYFFGKIIANIIESIELINPELELTKVQKTLLIINDKISYCIASYFLSVFMYYNGSFDSYEYNLKELNEFLDNIFDTFDVDFKTNKIINIEKIIIKDRALVDFIIQFIENTYKIRIKNKNI